MNILRIKRKKSSNFTIVRFGNVIGSSGSVIPIFLNQIKKKQPLTVTNKKARRYFYVYFAGCTASNKCLIFK